MVTCTNVTMDTPAGIGGVVHLFSDISGGQLNPAVSFGLFFSRQLSLYRAAVLSVAQIIGGVIGAGERSYLLLYAGWARSKFIVNESTLTLLILS